MSDPEDTIPGDFVITPAMSEKSRKRAENEALENAKRVVDEINEAANDPKDPGEQAG